VQYEGAHGVPCEIPRHGTHPHHRGVGWDGLQPDKSTAEFACKDKLNRSRPSARSCDGWAAGRNYPPWRAAINENQNSQSQAAVAARLAADDEWSKAGEPDNGPEWEAHNVAIAREFETFRELFETFPTTAVEAAALFERPEFAFTPGSSCMPAGVPGFMGLRRTEPHLLPSNPKRSLDNPQ
jgi:hypothetical protein